MFYVSLREIIFDEFSVIEEYNCVEILFAAEHTFYYFIENWDKWFIKIYFPSKSPCWISNITLNIYYNIFIAYSFQISQYWFL